MKQEVNAADVRAMNRDGIIYTILLAATIILPALRPRPAPRRI